VNALRNRQIRNLLASLLLAPGVPMLLMGDEVRRSQGGNNNTWCQNNPLGWMHWQPDDDDLALRRFLQRLLALRRRLAPLLNPELPFGDGQLRRAGDGGPPWHQWHGVELGQPDWASWSHCLAWSLQDPMQGALLWCGLNAYYQPMTFSLPHCATGWHQVINTALPEDADLPDQPQPFHGAQASLESRSLVLLVAQPLLG
jgi:glycogen operon protein